jgi:chemotaxis protein histidine kinase CheA
MVVIKFRKPLLLRVSTVDPIASASKEFQAMVRHCFCCRLLARKTHKTGILPPMIAQQPIATVEASLAKLLKEMRRGQLLLNETKAQQLQQQQLLEALQATLSRSTESISAQEETLNGMEQQVRALEAMMGQGRVRPDQKTQKTRKLEEKNRRLQKRQTEAEERLGDWMLSTPKPSDFPHVAHVMANGSDSADDLSLELSLAPTKRKLFPPLAKPKQKKKARSSTKSTTRRSLMHYHD